MARRLTYAEAESADSQLVAVGQLAVRGGQPLGAQAEGERLVRCVSVQEAVRRMEAYRGPRFGLEPGHAEHVIAVRVGEPDPDRPPAFGLQLVGDHSRF